MEVETEQTADDNSEHKRFEIQDEQALEWALRKIEQVRQEIQGQLNMKQKSDDYFDKNIKELKVDRDNLISIVDEYAHKQVDQDPTWHYTKSPFGRLVQSKPKTSLVKADEDALKKQFKGTKYVTSKTVEKLDWGDLKKTLQFDEDGHVFNEDGEIVEGVKVKNTPAKLELKHKNAKGSWTTKEE